MSKNGITVTVPLQMFPAGTLLAAYPRGAQRRDGGPPGPAAESQKVTDGGTATFSKLSPSAAYAFHAQVDGEHRWLQRPPAERG